MSIELRNLNGIRNAKQALENGDYRTAPRVDLRLFETYFIHAESEDYEATLVETMAALENVDRLTNLDVRPSSNDKARCKDCFLPAHALATAIKACPKLETLKLHNVCLSGSESDFEELATATQGLPQLQNFYFFSGVRLLPSRVAETSNGGTCLTAIDGVLSAVGTSPTLKHVKLLFGKTNATISAASLRSLCRSSKLEEFHILNSDILEEGIIAISEGLTSKQHLTNLSLCTTDLGLKGCEALHSLFSGGRCPNLNYLHFVVREISCGLEKRAVFYSALAQAFGSSSCKDMRIGVPSIHRSSAVHAMVEMLRGNYKVSAFQLDNIWTETKNDEIDFLVQTNKLGRGSLFQSTGTNSDGSNGSTCSWITLFGATEGKLDNIYYLIRSHPNEFAAMGLQDCSLNLLPTTRVLTTLLRQNQAQTKRCHRAIEASTAGVEDNLQEALYEMEANLEGRIRDPLEEKLDRFQQTLEAKLAAKVLDDSLLMSLMAKIKRSIKDSIASRFELQTTALNQNLQAKVLGTAVLSPLLERIKCSIKDIISSRFKLQTMETNQYLQGMEARIVSLMECQVQKHLGRPEHKTQHSADNGCASDSTDEEETCTHATSNLLKTELNSFVSILEETESAKAVKLEGVLESKLKVALDQQQIVFSAQQKEIASMETKLGSTMESKLKAALSTQQETLSQMQVDIGTLVQAIKPPAPTISVPALLLLLIGTAALASVATFVGILFVAMGSNEETQG